MIYSSTEKSEIDAVRKAFGGYINQHSYFDIVYSDKIGYLYLLVNPEDDSQPVFIGSADKLFRILISEIIDDVCLAPGNQEHQDYRISTKEEQEIRRRALPLIEAIEGGRQRYLACFEQCLRDYPQSATDADIGYILKDLENREPEE